MKQIILNADDFGRHKCINDAVVNGVTQGCLRSASLMAVGPAFDEAVRICKQYPELGTGLHLTLIDGHPILPADEIPSLVTNNGCFYADHNAFLKQFLCGRIRLDEVRRELAAQLQKLQAAGLQPDHIDSHQHMHVLPGIIDIALDLAKSTGIPALRIPTAPLTTPDGLLSDGIGAFIGRAGLHTLAAMARWKANRAGLYAPEHFTGIVAGDAVDQTYLASILKHLPDGTTEVMLHPGTNNLLLQAECNWDHDFIKELEAITAPEIRDLMVRNHIECTNFQR